MLVNHIRRGSTARSLCVCVSWVDDIHSVLPIPEKWIRGEIRPHPPMYDCIVCDEEVYYICYICIGPCSFAEHYLPALAIAGRLDEGLKPRMVRVCVRVCVCTCARVFICTCDYVTVRMVRRNVLFCLVCSFFFWLCLAMFSLHGVW